MKPSFINIRTYMKERNTKIWTALDLEMNQPSGKIIQIGAVKFNIETKEVYASFNQLVCIDEPLCTDIKICDIPALTGITEERLLQFGIPLTEAYEQMAIFHKAPVMIGEEQHSGMVNPVVWGGDDARCLKQELLDNGYKFDPKDYFCFGNRIFDIKSFHQWISMANGMPFAGGLSRSMAKWKVNFRGRKHDAEADAYNTAMLACSVFKSLQGTV